MALHAAPPVAAPSAAPMALGSDSSGCGGELRASDRDAAAPIALLALALWCIIGGAAMPLATLLAAALGAPCSVPALAKCAPADVARLGMLALGAVLALAAVGCSAESGGGAGSVLAWLAGAAAAPLACGVAAAAGWSVLQARSAPEVTSLDSFCVTCEWCVGRGGRRRA